MVAYSYDSLNRLQAVADWQERITAYTYDAAGRMQTVTLPNGVTSVSTFDGAGRLSRLAHTRGETGLASYQYDYDLSGNRLQAVEDVRQMALTTNGGIPSGWTPPTQFAVEEQGYLAVTLGWPDSQIGEEGYTLERSTDGQNWQVVAELNANTQRYVDYGLARHTHYEYRLTAHNTAGGSEVQTVQAETAAEPVTDGLTQTTEPQSLVIDYTYDALNRLKTAMYDDGTVFGYSYDAAGNTLQAVKTTDSQTKTTVYSYDADNQLQTAQENGVQYGIITSIWY